MRSYCSTILQSNLKESLDGSKNSADKSDIQNIIIKKKSPQIIICSPRRKPYLSEEDTKSTPKAYQPYFEMNQQNEYLQESQPLESINLRRMLYQSISPTDMLLKNSDNVFVSPQAKEINVYNNN